MTCHLGEVVPDASGVIEVITSSRAELVVLHHTTPTWEKFLRDELSPSYPHMHFDGEGWALLSRKPVNMTALLEMPEIKEVAMARMNIQTSIGELPLLQLRSSGPSASPHDDPEIARYLARVVEQQGQLPAIIVGDFHGDEGQTTAWLTREKGLKSALPEFSQAKQQWHEHSSSIELTQRHEHVLYDPAQLFIQRESVMDRAGLEHMPVVLSFSRR